MTEILAQWQSCDGWKVHIRTGGQTHFLNLPSQSSEVELADAITAFELQQQAEKEAEDEAAEILEIVE